MLSDIVQSMFADSIGLALSCVIDAAVPMVDRPPRLFPTIDTFHTGHYSYTT